MPDRFAKVDPNNDDPMNAAVLVGCSMVLAGLCVGLVSKDVDRFGELMAA
jgi:hypothetical protein